jgi:hypothetical protein
MEIVVDSGRVDGFDRAMCPVGLREEANWLIGDHRPITLRVRSGGEDNGGEVW